MPPLLVPHLPRNHLGVSAITTPPTRRSYPITPLQPRQQNDDNFIPETYSAQTSSPTPGAVVAIVLGSVAGFLLLLWLIHICLNFGLAPALSTSTVGGSSTTGHGSSIIHASRRKLRRHSGHHHGSSGDGGRRHSSGGRRSSSRKETVEIRTSTSHAQARPFIVDGPAEEDRRRRRSQGVQGARGVPVVVESTRRSGGGRPIVIPVGAPTETTTTTISSSSSSGTDEIVVIEPPIRPPPTAAGGRRHSNGGKRNSGGHKGSGYGGVHSGRFSGGDQAVRNVRRSGSYRRT